MKNMVKIVKMFNNKTQKVDNLPIKASEDNFKDTHK